MTMHQSNPRLGMTYLILSLALFISHGSVVQAAGTTLKQLAQPVAAPAFSLLSAEGQTYTLKQFRGRVLVVNFWATWCPPCVKEMPALERAWQHLRPHGVELVAIDFGDDANVVKAFAADTNLSLPLLLDPQGTEAQRWGMRGLPATYVLDRDGQIVFTAQGERQWDHEDMLGIIRQLAAKPWQP
ncbi:MAG: redoxin domain-containing protein [Chromatiales bacterium]|jgi:peroxiredoxin|nr:redoxin domain-containing protein [Chromatiales bacterium]